MVGDGQDDGQPQVATEEGDGEAMAGDGDDGQPSTIEIPDDHVFMIETDSEKGEEPWSYEELKQSAQLTEEAIKWKGLGEQAVEQRNRLVTDIRQNPMEAMLNVATAITGNAEQARAWLIQHATALINQNLEYEAMDPTDRANLEKDRVIQDLQGRLETASQAEVTATQQREAQEAFERTHNEIVTAVQALGHEADDSVIQDVANVLDQAHLAGHTHITASSAAKMVMKELEERATQHWTDFDPAKAPPEALEKFRQHEVALVKANQKPATPPAARQDPDAPTRRSRRAAGLGI